MIDEQLPTSVTNDVKAYDFFDTNEMARSGLWHKFCRYKRAKYETREN